MAVGWVELGLAIAVPAVLVAAASHRFLIPVMLAWMASPLLVYAGMIVWEMLTRPPVANALGTAFYGFMLVSPILAIPWLVACLIGFGLGFCIRRLLRPVRRGPGRPAPDAANPAATRPRSVGSSAVDGAAAASPGSTARTVDVAAAETFPSRAVAASPETPGWRHVHIGFDHDALKIGGLDVWSYTWRPTGE